MSLPKEPLPHKTVKTAVAVQYDRGADAAPRITAAGKGSLAERILEAARRAQVPIHENKELASALVKLEVNGEIPQELYRAVAEVLAFVYRMDAQRKQAR